MFWTGGIILLPCEYKKFYNIKVLKFNLAECAIKLDNSKWQKLNVSSKLINVTNYFKSYLWSMYNIYILVFQLYCSILINIIYKHS